MKTLLTMCLLLSHILQFLLAGWNPLLFEVNHVLFEVKSVYNRMLQYLQYLYVYY